MLASFTASALLHPPRALANERHITCGSLNYGYNYCRIYTGGRVRLSHQISKHSCSQGDSWGYDSQGVWVDKGCRADFVVDESYGNSWSGGYNNGYNPRYGSNYNNYNDSSSSDDDDNLGAALGVAAGVAILGAIIGASGSNTNSGYNSHYDQRHSATIPSWAIGTFQGHNSRRNAEAILTITPTGQVNAIANGMRLNGYFDGRTLQFQQMKFDVERSNNGLTTIQQGNYNNQVHYYRVR
jgi:hypothetical protein